MRRNEAEAFCYNGCIDLDGVFMNINAGGILLRRHRAIPMAFCWALWVPGCPYLAFYMSRF